MKNTSKKVLLFLVLVALLIAGSISAYAEGSTESPGGTPAPSGGRTPALRGGGGTFTLTGIPSKYNGKYALFSAEIPNSGWSVDGFQDKLGQDNYRLIRVQGTSITFPLWRSGGTEGSNQSRYRGNETLGAVVWFYDKATVNGWDSIMNDDIGAVYFFETKFSNGSATRAWSSADYVE